MRRSPIRLRLNVVIGISSFVASALLAFVSYRLVLKLGGLELLGLWSALLSATFLIRLGDLGLGAAAVRYVALLPKGASIREGRQLIDTIVLFNAALFLALSVIGLIVLSYIFAFLAGIPSNSSKVTLVSQILPILMFGFMLQGISGATLAVLQGLHLGYLSSGITVVGLLVQMLFVLILIPDHGLLGFAWAMVAQNTVVMLVSWGTVLRKTASLSAGILPVNYSLEQLRRTLKFGIGLQAVNIVNGFFDPVAKLLIGRFSGLEALGTFELASRSVHVLRGLVNSAVLATVPASADMMTSNISEMRSLYLKLSHRTVWAFGGLLGLALLTSPLISLLWLDRVDKVFLLVLAIVSAGVMGNVFGAPAYTLGVASGKLAGNFISAGSSIITLLLLVPLAASVHPIAGIGASAIAMALGGVLVKWRNEKILFSH